MRDALGALEAILVDEVSLYRQLAQRLPFKLALIRRNRVDQLERLTHQEEADLRRLAELESVRHQAVDALLAHLPAGTPARLVELVLVLPEAWQTRFNTLGAELKGYCAQLQEGHARCVAMLHAGLEAIDITMSLVGQAAANNEPALYGRDAGTAMQAPSFLLDRRA